MNLIGSGFITIINSSSTAETILEEFALMTENNVDLFTENSDFILV